MVVDKRNGSGPLCKEVSHRKKGYSVGGAEKKDSRQQMNREMSARSPLEDSVRKRGKAAASTTAGSLRLQLKTLIPEHPDRKTSLRRMPYQMLTRKRHNLGNSLG